MSEKDWKAVCTVLWELYAPEEVMVWAKAGRLHARAGRATLEGVARTHLRDAVQAWMARQ